MAVLCGIDAGEKSVGLAAVVVDDEGMPISVPYLMSVKHDGGVDKAASSNTQKVSRKASGGTARRARTHKQNRRRHRKQLRDALVANGFPLVDMSNLPTYKAWEARIELCTDHVPDPERRQRLISIAIQHMERHRGWANAWLSVNYYLYSAEPSEDFVKAVEQLEERSLTKECEAVRLEFQSDVAQFGLTNQQLLRERNKGGTKRVQPYNLLGRQRREDVAREWRHICELQGLDDELFVELGTLAFQQEHPRVPEELVGSEWVPGYRAFPRASKSSLEFQEFRMRQEIANLAIKSSPRSKESARLTIDQQRILFDTLSGITSIEEQPTWRELAECLEIEASLLTHTNPDEQLTAKAPINRTIVAIHLLPKKHPVSQWWPTAEPAERSALISRLGDAAAPQHLYSTEIDALLSSLDHDETTQLEKLRLDSGRAGHCLTVLQMLSEEIRDSGDDYTTVRNRLFNNGHNMVPERDDLTVPAQHPTLQRVIPPVRRFLMGVERKVGPLDQVTIEHVRAAFLGTHALKELENEQKANRKERERVTSDYRAQNPGAAVSRAMIRKFQLIRRQNSQCLYCGETLGSPSQIELDHIVPRAGGGSNRQANLAAVCSSCNQQKGKDPFMVFAESGRNPRVSVEEAMERVRGLDFGSMPKPKANAIRKEMRQRLRQRTEDQPVDERALASTAYAAVELRNRIQATFGDEVKVPVYKGSIVSAARKASRIDEKLELRSGLVEKSRIDRRHHAIDAAVASMLNPSVVITLSIREQMRDVAKLTGRDNGWKTYQGEPGSERARKFEQWVHAMDRLAQLIRERLDEDDVPVVQPLRMSANHGQLHEAGRAAHISKALGEEWTAQEISRVVDKSVYRYLVDALGTAKKLPTDPARAAQLTSGKWLSADDPVYLFKGANDARIPLPRNSSAKLGATMHHGRLYRVRSGNKAFIELLRIFSADLYELPDMDGGDILTQPVDPYSRAVQRSTRPRLRAALLNGSAEHIMSFVPGDEVYLEPDDWGGGKSDFHRFMEVYSEKHWEVKRISEDDRISLSPLSLAEEGLPPAPEAGDDPHKFLRESLKNGLRVMVSALVTTPGTRLVRRNSLGEIRSMNRLS